MASFRTTLSKSNMDLVMYVVRKFDCNPSDAMNILLEQPNLIIDARSRIYEKEKRGHQKGQFG